MDWLYFICHDNTTYHIWEIYDWQALTTGMPIIEYYNTEEDLLAKIEEYNIPMEDFIAIQW